MDPEQSYAEACDLARGWGVDMPPWAELDVSDQITWRGLTFETEAADRPLTSHEPTGTVLA